MDYNVSFIIVMSKEYERAVIFRLGRLLTSGARGLFKDITIIVFSIKDMIMIDIII